MEYGITQRDYAKWKERKASNRIEGNQEALQGWVNKLEPQMNLIRKTPKTIMGTKQGNIQQKIELQNE
jgi:hypothetical protein